MGCCFSTISTDVSTAGPPTAKVIALDGTLREYFIPITASAVLATTTASHFLCNSDKLLCDRHIPRLRSSDSLEPDQIYFILPLTKLKYTLSNTDMAALAVKASSAISVASKRGRGRRIKVAPVEEINAGFSESISTSSRKISKKNSWRLHGMIRRQLSTIEESA